MIHPHVSRQATPACGVGVVATQFIRAGTIVVVECPACRIMTRADIDSHPDAAFLLAHAPITASTYPDYLVPCDDTIFYFNHACAANVLSIGDGLDMAVDDIPAGVAMTYDYRMMVDEHIDFCCKCGHATCAGQIACKPPQGSLLATWRRRITPCLAAAAAMRQPIFQPGPVATLHAALDRFLALHRQRQAGVDSR